MSTHRPLRYIAKDINAFLHRFAADPALNGGDHPAFYQPSVSATTMRVNVTYISYQGTSSLKRDEAEAYLEWLKAGNVGQHFRMPNNS